MKFGILLVMVSVAFGCSNGQAGAGRPIAAARSAARSAGPSYWSQDSTIEPETVFNSFEDDTAQNYEKDIEEWIKRLDSQG